MAALGISDFSRATHLGVKALRHYHQIGLLVPDEVDDLTGYRRYGPDQIAEALVIKQFRDLDMPLEEIRDLLAAPDGEQRAALLGQHLDRLINELARMRKATDRLDELLSPRTTRWPEVQQRNLAARSGIAIRDTIEVGSALAWLNGAFAELGAALRLANARSSAPAVGVFADELFTEGRGEAMILVPCAVTVTLVGRVQETSVSAGAFCVATHHGPAAGIQRAYAALGEHVARHEIAMPGPLREIYVVGPLETATEADWVTEVAWPVFRTRGGPD